MFREMRRKKQGMTMQKCIEVLKNNTSGVLALLGDEDYPYTVPLSYVYYDGHLYFHSAKVGHKIDAVKKYPKASFCIIDKDEIHPEQLTTYYRSIIAFGNVKLLDNEEKMIAIEALGLKYNPHHDTVSQEIERFKDAFEIIDFHIEHLTGKEAVELL